MLKISRTSGNPNLGVFSRVNENFAFIATNHSDEFASEVEEHLDVQVIKTSVAGSFVVGSLMATNSNGAVVSSLIEIREYDRIKKHLNVALLRDEMNAAGNNILANDHGAIINPRIDSTTMKDIEDALGVECVQATIAGVHTVGSVCCATNRGAVIHPGATKEEIDLIKDVLKVEAVRTTLNHGCRIVSSGAIANSKGALVGDLTTPIELGKLEDGLHYY